MAATGKTTKRKLYLQVSPHSVSIEFQPNAVSLSASLPALFLRISRGSRATESTQATLQGLSGSTYRASWMSSTLPINVVLSQDTASGKVERKEIKFQLKIASEGKLTHKSLAGCTYDISCLNLSALDYTGVSSETRQISLNTGKSAAAAVAIRAITLEATFRYEFLHDDFEISVEQSRSRETSPAHARSSPPIDLPTLIGGAVNGSPVSESVASEKHSQQLDSHTKSRMVTEQDWQDSQNNTSQHDKDPHSYRERVQSSPAQSSRSPKPPKKRFKWFKKVKGGSKHSSAKHRLSDTSKVVESFSSALSSTSQSSMPSPMDSVSAVLDLPMHSITVTQSDDLKTQLNRVWDTEALSPKETGPPPKPKRSANKLKAADSSIVPKLQAETLVQGVNQPEENEDLDQMLSHGKEGHQPLTLPLQQNCLSTSLSSEDSADDRTRSYSAPSLATKKKLMQMCNSTSVLSANNKSEEKKEAQSSAILKCYHPHSNTRSSPVPPTVANVRGLPKYMSGSTPHLSQAKLTHGQRSSSVSHLAYQKRRGPKPTISDLIKPTAFASRTSLEGCISASTKPSADQHLGILKVRLKALDTSEDFQSAITKASTDGKVESNKQQKAAKEGLHCVFTISGGNGRFTSSVQPLVPHKTTTWDDNEEVLFYATPQSKKLFILCRRSTLEYAMISAVNTAETKSSRQILKGQNERCIGVAVLEISTVGIRSSSPTVNVCDYLAQVACEDHKLPVQPRGTMLLQSCLYVMQPRFKVSCTGTLTIQTLSGLHCNPDHDLSCTVKIDSDFQNDTNLQFVEDCARNGWSEEPVDFKACGSFDCSIQIWAYSSEETEYWCGGCVVPLAVLLPDEEVRRHTARGDMTSECALLTQVDKNITLPVEPKGVIGLSFSLVPGSNVYTHEHTPVADAPAGHDTTTHPADHSPNPETRPASAVPGQLQPPSVGLFKRGSLRRTTMRKAGNFNLKVLKSYQEEPFHDEDDSAALKSDLEEQTTDLKREVEFLREELRQTKAKLAESEFYREQAQLELRILRERESKDFKSTGKTKQNQ